MPPGTTESYVYSIDSAGDAAGSVQVRNELPHAFVWRNGTPLDLGYKFHTTEATAANPGGSTVGWDDLYNPSTNKNVDWVTGWGPSYPVGRSYFTGRAYAINTSGQFVGYTGSDTDHEGFVSSNGIRLGTGWLPGFYTASEAVGINDAGQVAGTSFSATASDAFLFEVYWGGIPHLTDIGMVGGLNSSARGINSQGHVVGVSDTASNQHHAFLWNGSITDLGTLPGGVRSEAAAINARGEVVGYSYDASGGRRPVIWQNGVIHDLNSFLPSGSGWTLSTATGINHAGQIVGKGVYNGSSRPYLLTPPTFVIKP